MPLITPGGWSREFVDQAGDQIACAFARQPFAFCGATSSSQPVNSSSLGLPGCLQGYWVCADPTSYHIPVLQLDADKQRADARRDGHHLAALATIPLDTGLSFFRPPPPGQVLPMLLCGTDKRTGLCLLLCPPCSLYKDTINVEYICLYNSLSKTLHHNIHCLHLIFKDWATTQVWGGACGGGGDCGGGWRAVG